MSNVKRPTTIFAGAPSVTDDRDSGYVVGWQWINTTNGDLYILIDSTVGAADWVSVGGGGGVTSLNTRTGAVTLIATDLPIFVASGGSNAAGAVPAPGATPGSTRFLCENSSWQVPGAPPLTLGYSPVDWSYLNVTTAPTTLTGNFTVGVQFTILTLNPIVGIRFYFASATARTIRCKLWFQGVEVASVDVAVSGVGVYEGTFGTAYTPVAGDLYRNAIVSVWDTINSGSGLYSRQVEGSVGTRRSLVQDSVISPGIVYRHFGIYVAGDGLPVAVSATERYPVEPRYV